MRSVAIILVALLVAIYICSLSVQVIAIHKHFRVEVAWGPLTVPARSRNVLENKLNVTSVKTERLKRNVTKNSVANTLKFVKEHMKKEVRTLPPLLHHRAPNFIIIGAQKAGTQALRTYLSDHPSIVVPTKAPETHYFDKYYSQKLSPKQNLKAYLKRSFNKNCRLNSTNCIAGESTPFYLYDTEHVPARIKAACPWVKLIVMLRDPVKRAYSQCSMLIDKNEIKGKTFEQHLEDDLNRIIDVGLISNRSLTAKEEDKAWIKYQNHTRWRKAMIGRGFYELQLRKWFQYFPREQFLIFDSQDLEQDRTATLKRVYEFLGLPYFMGTRGGDKIHRRKYTSSMSDNVRDFLYDFYQPYNERLARLLGPEWNGKWEKPVEPNES